VILSVPWRKQKCVSHDAPFQNEAMDMNVTFAVYVDVPWLYNYYVTFLSQCYSDRLHILVGGLFNLYLNDLDSIPSTNRTYRCVSRNS
jgi:hypothetical protein